MTLVPIYINGLGIVSPQATTDNGHFLEHPVAVETNRLRCADPGYREYIPAELIRRMGRLIKMGVTASKICLKDAGFGQESAPGNGIPDAIITGTGLGCIEDTEKFLTSMIKNNEEFLTPTSFIQSTHNTVAGQIALLLKCHSYNFTYVHRGISFESALIDAITQMQLGNFSNVLAGGTDELTDHSYAITSRLGHWKPKPIHSLSLLDDSQRGSIAGEGASFFFLENKKSTRTYARLDGVSTFLKPSSGQEISSRLHDFLRDQKADIGNIGMVLLGLSGDRCSDQFYHDFMENNFPEAASGFFKHLCGEYQTASAFATWLASMILKTQTVPEVVRISRPPTRLEQVLIYNHYRGNNHSFILLSRP